MRGEGDAVRGTLQATVPLRMTDRFQSVKHEAPANFEKECPGWTEVANSTSRQHSPVYVRVIDTHSLTSWALFI